VWIAVPVDRTVHAYHGLRALCVPRFGE
jgi:hypothetical protein